MSEAIAAASPSSARATARRFSREPGPWVLAAAVALALGLPQSAPLFAWWFPELDRPVYQQDSFIALLAWHVGLVALSSAAAAVVGVGAALAVTREPVRPLREPLERLVNIGQTVPPVAVLALAVPSFGFGTAPVLLALFLYGLLPIVRGTLAGIEAVPADVREAATGAGMSSWQRLAHAELPLAWPGILAGLRSSVAINIGTATIAATVGVRSLGSPIIVGLAGFNTAYVVQGALLVALLAAGVDALFESAARRFEVRRAA